MKTMKYHTCHANPLVSILYLFFTQFEKHSLSLFFSFLLHLCSFSTPLYVSFIWKLPLIYFLYAPILFPSLYFHSLSSTILNSACLLSFHSTQRQPLCISNPGTYYMKINKNKHVFMFPSVHISSAISVHDTYVTLIFHLLSYFKYIKISIGNDN